ncbi:hypothetical protein TVAG_071740 [Trichomonas vaginalis G3]|uniref:Uncharacterized protein n=1 Tax=Trichomonas vaginalis (strain ATCC PRA-98 / G3) TaxID=412133 RepID=A2D877_TRIV3|nr:hypothetical protein TVAGG3_1046850 [Trichomonas vaginalis G3]EAY23510.1 hypothetical protein TVAG_071740 [Trichomonas vaginalis G3]KAI5493932.1 hypothetical protein TVAGG3_1046850 [Trichomonas vaginalis G3]|eukprot:XP_001584496.1 hypothetical protein [Trichomonas vaginalis G3]
MCSPDINSTKYFTISPDLTPVEVKFYTENTFPAHQINLENLTQRININEISLSECIISDSIFSDIFHDQVGGAINIVTSNINLNISYCIFDNLSTYSLYNNVEGGAIYLCTLTGNVLLDRLCIRKCSALDSSHFIYARIRSINETSFIFNNSCVINCPKQPEYIGQTMEVHASSIFNHLNFSNNHPDKYAIFDNSETNEKNLTHVTVVSNTLIYNNSINMYSLMLCPHTFTISRVNFIQNFNNFENKTDYFIGFQYIHPSNLYFDRNVNFNETESSEINNITFEDYCYREKPKENKNRK